MKPFRIVRHSCVFALVGLWMLSGIHALGAEPPALRAPVTYVGEYLEGQSSYRVSLYLGAPQGFVLREELALPNGKINRWDQVGKWHQIRQGAFLQLTNTSGFYKLFTVGGAGDLYTDVQIPDGGHSTVVLRPRAMQAPEYTASGMLRAGGGKTLLHDADSGVASLVQGDSVAAFVQAQNLGPDYAVAVQATVRALSGKADPPALQVLEIESIAPKHAWGAYTSPQYFLDAVVGASWKLTRLGRDTPKNISLQFIAERGEGGGRLEYFDGSRHQSGSYTLQDRELRLLAHPANPALAALLQKTRSWQLAGEVLELWDETQVLALLEKRR